MKTKKDILNILVALEDDLDTLRSEPATGANLSRIHSIERDIQQLMEDVQTMELEGNTND